MKLEDIAVILACSKPAASMLRSGSYTRQGGTELVLRYARLEAVVTAAADAAQAHDFSEICKQCPRDDCTGCRVAELS